MEGKIDLSSLSSLSVEQLQELLRAKKAENPGNESEPQNVCSFVPKRANQLPCTEVAVFHYGDYHCCKKHNRTVGAINAKKEWQEQNRLAEPVQEPTEEPTAEPTVVEPVVEDTPEPKVELVAEPVVEPAVEKPVEKVVEKVVEKPAKEVSKPILKKTKSKPLIVKRVIKANKWGRFEDRETGIVFDPDSKAAYGVQNKKTGRVDPLSQKEIDICNRYKWKYHVLEETESSEKNDDEENEGSSEEKSSEEKSSEEKSSSEENSQQNSQQEH